MDERQVRRRDATATRQALRDAAAELFADRGFDRTTVRDIAKLAGVNQALLFRYFGSKEALFEEVMAHGGREQLATTPPSRLIESVLRGLLSPDKSGHRDHSLEVFLRSSSGGADGAAAVIRRELAGEYVAALASLTKAPNAELRADLVLAWLFGIGLVLSITGTEPLASADADEVCELVLTATRSLLEGNG